MPAQPFIPRRFSRPARGLCGRVLRAAIVLSLWHAPIPWVHAHDLDGPRVEGRQLLSEHVAEFHGRELSQGQKRLDWHMHLVLPWCIVHHLPCPDSDHRQPASDDFFGAVKMGRGAELSVKAIMQPTTRAFLAASLGADAARLLLSAIGTESIGVFGRGTHFFETYGRTSCVRDLVGVRLC